MDAARLAALLWPDAQTDAAKHSFDTTLYRLRKLLGHDDLLVLAEGRLSLDREQCWLDVGRSSGSPATPTPQPRATISLPNGLVSLGRAVFAAYPGHFLAAEEDAPWAIELSRPVAREVRAHRARPGRAAASGGPMARGGALYERALELDNLAEGLYRSLIICQRALGQTAVALQTFRRCRELLLVVLGLAPSPETEAVRRSLDATP